MIRCFAALFVLFALVSYTFGQGGQVGEPIYYAGAASTTGPVDETFVENYDPGTDDMYCVGEFELTAYGSVGTNGNPDTKDTWSKVSQYGWEVSSCWQMTTYFGANVNKHNYLASSLDYVWIESHSYLGLVDYVTVSNDGSVFGGGVSTTVLYDVENAQIFGGPYNGQTGMDTPKKGFINGKRHVTKVKLYARRIPGDTDEDGDVDFADFQVLSTNFNLNVTGGADDADFNESGKVDFSDFLILTRFYEGPPSDLN